MKKALKPRKVKWTVYWDGYTTNIFWLMQYMVSKALFVSASELENMKSAGKYESWSYINQL